MRRQKIDKPVVSVIITTRNEEKNIGACIKSILKQTFPQKKIEMIVVDNFSTDKTTSIVKKLSQKTSCISLYSFEPERSAQRNFGAQKAKGTYYMYLDADMTLSPNVITECVSKMKTTSSLAALYVPEIILGKGFWSKVRRFERSFYNATVIDCVRFLLLKDFLSVGGFDETMSGPEDWDLDKKIRLKGKVDIINAPLYHNEVNFNVLKYIDKKMYYVKSLKKYTDKWGKNDPDIQKQLGFFYRYIQVFIENGKWKKLVTHPLLTAGTILLKILVGMGYLKTKND